MFSQKDVHVFGKGFPTQLSKETLSEEKERLFPVRFLVLENFFLT